MPRFFTGEIHGDRALISGEDARHIALSLRMKPGETLTVCDSAGTDYQCTIASVDPAQVALSVGEAAPSAGEPKVRLHLYQALPKGDKFELIVQKAVELGVHKITPVLTRRCVSRPDEKDFLKKRERYQKIATEAAKQCGRGRLPEVTPLLPFPRAVEELAELPLSLLFYENADAPLQGTLASGLPEEVGLLIGSEGGFEPSEAEAAIAKGLKSVSLGSRILRCETAPLAALSALLYAAGEM